jgi:hypothetical protein
MRKLLAGLTTVAVLTTVALVTPAAAQAGSWCGIRWGSLDKASSTGGGSPLINVRAGRHQCYDRLVLDFRGPGSSAARVGYVPAVPYQARDGSLALRGGAFLNIVLLTTSYDINTGASTYTPANGNELVNVSGWQTFRQVADGGSFEGYTTIGLGVRARLPFRVFSLAGPGDHSRLVIDVAHHWGSSAAATAGGATDLPAPTSTAPVSVIHSQRVPPQPAVAAIRLGRHATYDRVVFDIHGAMPTYAVYYTARQGIPIRGTGVLEVSLHSVDTINSAAGPGPTVLPAIRDVEGLDAYEGYLDYGIGVSDRNGFRVFELQHPTRLVVDVAHDLPAPTSTALQYAPLGDNQLAHLVGIRTGAHPAYDRVVFEFRGPNSGLRYVVGYQGCWLRVDLEHGTVRGSYPGPWTLHPALAQLKAIRIVDGSVDGTIVLLGLGRTAGFRVFRLASPDRIVVDVAH